jgi:anhydro-N-acetylmuramic acid kinase
MRVAGIMSGTSLDGIDVAVVDLKRADLKGKAVTTIAHGTVLYSNETRRRILAVSNTQCHTADISRLNFDLGELYAKAVRTICRYNKLELETIELIGCHGQTIYHEGTNTLQIGEASVLAERLEISVVSDFRTRDIAAGGHGAPLVPFMDDLLFRSPKLRRVALNIGGIANITVLSDQRVIAFDTGPGNMVMDQLVTLMTNGRERFDRKGNIAARGEVNRALLDSLLEDPYYKASPPKTAGREQYGSQFIAKLTETGLPLKDLIATATAFTAATIGTAIKRFAPQTDEVIASGGGIHNVQLMAQLAALLPSARLTTTAEFGVDPDAKEAIAFAILAYRTWKREPGNLPSATGARYPVILGKLSLMPKPVF